MTISVPSERLPEIRQDRTCLLPDAARGMGLFFCATRGTGKSRTLGRVIAWQDFKREVPLVVLDPVGGTIDNLLDKIGREPLAVRQRLWQRVRYVNMAGQDGFVVPWPIYYESRAGERLSQRSERFIEVVRRSDPALAGASIQGLNALAPVAQAGGIVLSALGFGITELWSLASNPQAWERHLQAVEHMHPETAAAVDELRALGELSPRDRAARLLSLRSKLSLFRFHPNFRAIFGATTAGIDWQEVVDRKQAVLIDFRDIESAEVKQFCLLWVYNSFLTFVKQRGHGQMANPISFMVDELSYLTGGAIHNADLLASDIDGLVNRVSRSHGIWVTLAAQEQFQLPEQIRQTLLSMGTVIFGQTSDDRAAEELARRYYRYNPYLLKKTEHTYAPLPKMHWGYSSLSDFSPTSTRTTEFTRDEQEYLVSRRFLDLKRYHFLVGQSVREGELPTSLRPVSLEGVDQGDFPQRSVTDTLRSQLMRRDGIREDMILAGIGERLTASTTGAESSGSLDPPAVVSVGGEKALSASPALPRSCLPDPPATLSPLRRARPRKVPPPS